MLFWRLLIPNVRNLTPNYIRGLIGLAENEPKINKQKDFQDCFKNMFFEIIHFSHIERKRS